MFDIGAAELLLVAIVALVVIGPKDLPAALRGVGRVMGQLRSFTNQFRFSLDSMIREAEMEGQEKEWAQRNADIMAKHPHSEGDPGSGQEMQGQPDDNTPAKHDVVPPGDDGEEGVMKPLKPIATDESGEISSGQAASAPQPSAEPGAGTAEDSSQIDLFGGKS
ncbi:MAG: Sec-independent protein translocase protein TatB [Parasphingopyxis sp.]